MADNLFTHFVAAAPDPGKAFLLPPGAPAISYSEAFARAAQFAHVLIRHGLKQGDRVAVQVEKSPAALILYLACLRAGL
ncbi:MAG TPA: AMP-binding protein, partial [Rhizomicrobium sp.]|nr:AMP-binding protein [Rhizomicrobium sp.]